MKKLKAQYIKTMTQGIPDDLSDLKDEISEFTLFKNSKSWDVNWSTENIELLNEIGLPKSAPTMLEFCEQPVVDEEMVEIGFNNYGDKIIVEKSSGHIGFINHDFNNRFEYMNKDAVSLFKTVCLFAEMMKNGADFQTEIQSIDAVAFDSGNWWFQEFNNWKNK